MNLDDLAVAHDIRHWVRHYEEMAQSMSFRAIALQQELNTFEKRSDLLSIQKQIASELSALLDRLNTCRERAAEFLQMAFEMEEPAATADKQSRCFNIKWRDEEWTAEELKKAVEIATAVAYWLEDNRRGTPMPRWVYLSQPFDKDELLRCWEDWQATVRANSRH